MVDAEGEELLNDSVAEKRGFPANEEGILVNQNDKVFIKAIALHRFWSREK